MSTTLKQNIFYGVKVSYNLFKKLVDDDDFEAYDKAMADNNDSGMGWLVDGMNGEFAMLGKILAEGESMGDYRIVAAETDVVEIPLLEGVAKAEVDAMIRDTLGDFAVSSAKYYVVGLWG